MRHAISIAAAASGTVLLTLGLFGEPATYLREARYGWQSAPSTDDVVQSYAPPADTMPPDNTALGATSRDTTPPRAVPPSATPPVPTPSSTMASDATPPVPADRGSAARDTAMARMDALQTEVAKLREALAERGQDGTGGRPDSKDTDRQRGGTDNATHQETANPPPAVTLLDKGNQDAPPQVTPRTAPQAVAQRASPPAAAGGASLATAPAPIPRAAPPSAAPPSVAVPPAVAGAPAEPQIAERTPEPPKTTPANPPDARITERSEPPKAAADLAAPRIAERSEPPPAATPSPPSAERASPPESPSRAGRRSQSADRAEARDTASHRSETAASKPAPRVAVVTPPTPPSPPPATPPRATSSAGSPPLQAVVPPVAAPPRRDTGRTPSPGDDQDTDAVLARLRQAMQPPPPGAPTPEPMRLADASQASGWPAESATNQRASSGTGSVVGRLRAARSDLVSGRIEAARRQLQQAQLSLVFRPVGEEPNADAISAGAASVGKALSALGQNDVRGSVGFVDRATADLLHGGTGNGPPPLPQNEVAGGYAPAYPPR